MLDDPASDLGDLSLLLSSTLQLVDIYLKSFNHATYIIGSNTHFLSGEGRLENYSYQHSDINLVLILDKSYSVDRLRRFKSAINKNSLSLGFPRSKVNVYFLIYSQLSTRRPFSIGWRIALNQKNIITHKIKSFVELTKPKDEALIAKAVFLYIYFELVKTLIAIDKHTIFLDSSQIVPLFVKFKTLKSLLRAKLVIEDQIKEEVFLPLDLIFERHEHLIRNSQVFKELLTTNENSYINYSELTILKSKIISYVTTIQKHL